MVELVNHAEDGILGDLWVGYTELLQGLEARVRLAEDGVAVTRNDAARLEDGPQMVDDLLVGGCVSDLLLHGKDEREDLLVGQTVQRTGETCQSGGVAQEGVRQCGADQV